jgi:hypothetical protein
MAQGRYMIDRNSYGKYSARNVVLEDTDFSFSGNKDFGLVPVILWHEFHRGLLGQRDETIVAKFTRVLDPKFKNDPRWKTITKRVQYAIENNVYREFNLEPFSKLSVHIQGTQTGFRLERVLEDGTDNAREEHEYAPSWSRIQTENVENLRNQMMKVFGMVVYECK